MDAILRNLTDAQRQAVTHVNGPQLILAGPGSGKTRVVTHRIAYLLSQGIPPWQITALTFTNKSADEMRSRIESLAPGQPVWMGTFHRFCAQLLRKYASLVGLRENYSIYDMKESKETLKRAIGLANVSTSHTPPEQIASAIGRFKNRLVVPQMLEGHSLSSTEHVAAKVYPIYQQQLLIANAVDFDDLLLHVACMLRDNPELRADLDVKHRFILVDEYQDTNLAQYAIVRSLSVDHPNLSVTGDPDQSIYGWRGADISNILDFEKDYKNVQTVRLEANYRSTPEILHVADTLIRNNTRRKAKDLYTHNESGPPVSLRMYQDNYQEADDIADQIAANIGRGEIRPRNVAIFCRMNSLTRVFEHAFTARSIPYQIVNGTEFYQRKEVKDLLSYLHLINNPNHDVALMRVINTPTRGIGAKTVKAIVDHADRHRIPLLEAARDVRSISSLSARPQKKISEFVQLYDNLVIKATAPLPDLLRFLIEESGYQKYLEKEADADPDSDRKANVEELLSAATSYDDEHGEESSVEGFLEQVALVSDSDAWEREGDRVSIMTLHASKGLEFPHVYLIAVENGLLPHARSSGTDAGMEEERRLLFVGITRAERFLQLSYCKNRVFAGRSQPTAPSSFLIELPRGAMKIVDAPDPADFFHGDSDFDELNQDVGGGYPESWDEVQPNNELQADEDISFNFGDLQPKTSRPRGTRQVREPMPALSGLRTASDLLNSGADDVPGTNFNDQIRAGMRVCHPQYGEGEVMTISGAVNKRTAKIHFDIGHNQSFIVKYSPLKPVS